MAVKSGVGLGVKNQEVQGNVGPGGSLTVSEPPH